MIQQLSLTQRNQEPSALSKNEYVCLAVSSPYAQRYRVFVLTLKRRRRSSSPSLGDIRNRSIGE